MLEVIGILRHVARWLQARNDDIYWSNKNASPSAIKNSIGIYAIHGTADKPYAFATLAARLLEALPPDFDGINMISFESRETSLGVEGIAKQIGEKIEKRGHKQVFLIGHSRGGLAAAEFAESIASKLGIEVLGVATICSPFGGSHLAIQPLTSISKSISQMQPDSIYLKYLTDKIEKSAVPYHHIGAENDAIVAPIDCDTIRCKKNTKVFAGHGHMSIMSSRRLGEHLSTILSALVRCPRHEYLMGEVAENIANSAESAFSIKELSGVYRKINDIIDELENRYHAVSATKKLEVLITLRELVAEMIDGERGVNYPEAKSIGDFIRCYLNDSKIIADKKPIDIMREPLGTSMVSNMITMFASEPASYTQLNHLISAYESVPLLLDSGIVKPS